MKVLFNTNLNNDEVSKLVSQAVLRGFKRAPEREHLEWTDAERKQAIRYVTPRIIKESVA